MSRDATIDVPRSSLPKRDGPMVHLNPSPTVTNTSTPATPSSATEPFVLAFANMKGGSGKTTVAINFAVAAHKAGQKVIIFDCDMAQRSAVEWSALRNSAPPEVKPVDVGIFDKALHWTSRKGYTLVVVDLPGRDGADVTDILRRADFAIVPAQPTILDLMGSLPIRRALRGLTVPHRVLLTRLNSATTPRAAYYREAYGADGADGSVLDAVITDRVAHPDATARGLSVLEYSGLSARVAASEIWTAYDAFLEIIERSNG